MIIKNLTPEQLKEKMNQFLEQGNGNLKDSVKETETDENVKEGLTDEEKQKLKKKLDGLMKLLMQQVLGKNMNIQNANLIEAEIDGKNVSLEMTSIGIRKMKWEELIKNVLNKVYLQ